MKMFHLKYMKSILLIIGYMKYYEIKNMGV